MTDKQQKPLTASFVVEAQSKSVTQQVEVRPAQTFESEDFSADDEQPISPDGATEKPRKPMARTGLWLLVLLLTGTVIELVLFSVRTFSEQNLLGVFWLGVLALMLILSGRVLCRTLFELKALKGRAEYRQQAYNYYINGGVGNAEKFCQEYVAHLPLESRQQWQQLALSERTDKEVIQLFEQHIVSQADGKALQHISKHASATGVMIAVSPLAAMDMLVVLWRSFSMLQQIADCYGIQLGYWARIKLMKKAFKLMVFAGATEVLIEAGGHALGASFSAKLSAQLAQGVGAGVLVSRLGLQAIQQCRPVPWLSQEKPKVTDISRQLISQIKNLKTD